MFLALLACVFAGCASNLPEHIRFADPHTEYVLEVDSNDIDQRFILKLSSLSDEYLCIGVDDWPNVLGQISGGSDRAVVSGGEETFYASDTNFGYCVGDGCTIRIRPRQTLTAFVGYKEFADPHEIAAIVDKKLTYRLRPFICAHIRAR